MLKANKFEREATLKMASLISEGYVVMFRTCNLVGHIKLRHRSNGNLIHINYGDDYFVMTKNGRVIVSMEE